MYWKKIYYLGRLHANGKLYLYAAHLIKDRGYQNLFKNIFCNCLNFAHYHLQVQANSKKIVQKKTMLFLASMGETGLIHDIFFQFSLRPFKVFEAKGGHLVKEADFEAEKHFLLKKII